MSLWHNLMILCNESHKEKIRSSMFLCVHGHIECMHMHNIKSGFVTQGTPGTLTPLLSARLLRHLS